MSKGCSLLLLLQSRRFHWMSLSAAGSVEPLSFHQNTLDLLHSSKRRDDRTLSALRPVTVQRNVSDRSLASATVALGGSVAMCAIRGCFGPPTQTAPNEGRIEVHIEAPFASPHLEATQDAQRALCAFVRDVVRSTLTMSALSVVPGEACWVLNIDITILSADGALRPLCLHAVVAALERLVLPRARLPNGEYSTELLWGYQLGSIIPVAVTCAVAHGVVLLDTSAAEESVADALMTVVLDGKSITSAPSILYVAHHGGHPAGGAKLLEAICSAVAQNCEAMSALLS
jgi:exosome complex component RRP45